MFDTNARDPSRTGIHSRSVVSVLLVAAFSIIYFVEVCIRASEKRFWFDELCTLYICRLPTFEASWQAVLHGADYNPPFFYLVMRTARNLFGEGLIAFRIPAIVGFWILCLCLFCFVHRRAGTLPAFCAMVLPILSGAYYYAYDARPHGIILGLCGLAVLFWQLASDRLVDLRATRLSARLWELAFSATLAAAFLTHCYGVVLVVPFACAELVRTVRSRRLNWSMWMAMIAPAIVATALLLPLLRAYRQTIGGTGFGEAYFHADLGQLAPFYVNLLSPCTLVLLFAAILFVLDHLGLWNKVERSRGERPGVTLEEVALTMGFVFLPIFGIAVGRIINGPFVPRYFLSALCGFCLMLGWSTAYRFRPNRVALIVSLVLAGLICKHLLGLLSRHLHEVGESLTEPSTSETLNTAPGDPLRTQSLLISGAANSLPIVVANGHDFLYLFNYAPSLAPRVYSVSWDMRALKYRLDHALRVWCHLDFNRERTFDEFLPSNPHFLLYGTQAFLVDIPRLMERGGAIRTLKFGSDHFLAEIEMRR